MWVGQHSLQVERLNVGSHPYVHLDPGVDVAARVEEVQVLLLHVAGEDHVQDNVGLTGDMLEKENFF